jgi:hypothetical protein
VAAGIVYNITGGSDMTLQEINAVSEVVTSMADPSCNIIFGAVVDDAYSGLINVTIIATGFSQSFEEQIFAGSKPGASRRLAAQPEPVAAQVSALHTWAAGACHAVCFSSCLQVHFSILLLCIRGWGAWPGCWLLALLPLLKLSTSFN